MINQWPTQASIVLAIIPAAYFAALELYRLAERKVVARGG